MKKKLKLTESDIHSLVREVINILYESVSKMCVYHCGETVSKLLFNDVIWFSSTPLECFGDTHMYEITMHNPLVINAKNACWGDKLWLECCEPNGSPIMPPDDPYLTSKAPAFIWKLAQESTEEYEYGDIPYIVKDMKDRGEVNYDGVIIKNIYETPNGNVKTDDYVVFSLEQVKLVK